MSSLVQMLKKGHRNKIFERLQLTYLKLFYWLQKYERPYICRCLFFVCGRRKNNYYMNFVWYLSYGFCYKYRHYLLRWLALMNSVFSYIPKLQIVVWVKWSKYIDKVKTGVVTFGTLRFLLLLLNILILRNLFVDLITSNKS